MDIKGVLKNIAGNAIREQCEKDVEMLYQQKMLPAAQNGAFFIEINSEENSKLREGAYRKALIGIFEKRGFAITESYDRDECFLTISWSEKK